MSERVITEEDWATRALIEEHLERLRAADLPRTSIVVRPHPLWLIFLVVVAAVLVAEVAWFWLAQVAAPVVADWLTT